MAVRHPGENTSKYIVIRKGTATIVSECLMEPLQVLGETDGIHQVCAVDQTRPVTRNSAPCSYR